MVSTTLCEDLPVKAIAGVMQVHTDEIQTQDTRLRSNLARMFVKDEMLSEVKVTIVPPCTGPEVGNTSTFNACT